ncbi:ATP-binding protein [Calothrix sp. PCC 6303]|uniref:ATP-binding protein n=1 Tax=Calothrix sp. PCC 6303 TaxID=1170562 RepID=UPI0002A03449|nr:ATP-binding protein [Calothrix sp. PCC 6303]AFZ04423.1 multi-sensor signal transduction histidine kinase [Calothrix sp. PCC 6303]
MNLSEVPHQYQFPASIQPHGILLILTQPELNILQISNNSQKYLGKSPLELLGKPLSVLLGTSQASAVKECLSPIAGVTNHLKLVIEADKWFDAMVTTTPNRDIPYSQQQLIILELEPSSSKNSISFSDFHSLVRDAVSQIQTQANLNELLNIAVTAVKNITGFDRVMAYRFYEDLSGSVIAEVKRSDLATYLGLHYPATDIPQPARDFYSRCLLRYIPNLNAELVELIPRENPITQTPLNLSFASLRGFSRCCVEYHQNMDVAAIMVISLLKEGKLWGLISCHHQTPKYLPYDARIACEFFVQIVSLELAAKVSNEELDYQVKLRSLQSEFIDSISKADNFVDALVHPAPRLLDLVSAEGAAVILGEDITLVGKTPDLTDVTSLIQWLETQIRDNLFHSNSLPKIYPKASSFKDTASGLLLLQISQVRRYYILWFRPEVLQTVNWAGNPADSIQFKTDGTVTLSPRKSFESWQETVRFTSLPWKTCELHSALALRNAIIGIVISKIDELAKINTELERSNRELAAFAYASSHDLKEPLRGIYNYSNILLEDYGNLLDEEGIDYIKTITSLSVRMETLINGLLRLSQLGQSDLHLHLTNLNLSLKSVIDVFRASRQDSQFEILIPRPLPSINCDSTLVNEIFTNLITNAFKYSDRVAALSEHRTHKIIEIGYLEPGKLNSSTTPVFYVRDNGIGIKPHHLETIFRLFKRLHSQEKYGGGAGAGLAIAKRIVERHGGRIWVESTFGQGSTFYFTLAP